MPESKTYFPNGLKVGTALEVDTDAPAEINGGLIVDTSMVVDVDEMSIGENAELTIGHDGTDGYVKADNVAPSDVKIITGAEKTFVLETPIYDDLPPVPIAGARLGSTAPTLTTFIDDIEQYTFDNVNDYVIGATEITHKYKEGTDLLIHVHWATNGTEVADKTVKWQIKYTIANGGTAFGSQVTETGEAVILADTDDRQHIITALGTIPGAALKIGAYVLWRFERIASSGIEPAANPFALAVGIHNQMDTAGSRGIFTK